MSLTPNPADSGEGATKSIVYACDNLAPSDVLVQLILELGLVSLLRVSSNFSYSNKTIQVKTSRGSGNSVETT